MNPNLASLMPQVIAAWCEELGHEVTYVCYTGFEDLKALVAQETDAVFIAAFSRAAQTAYAISNLYRKRGVVTILGGPHARAYPEDAQNTSIMCWASPTGRQSMKCFASFRPHPKFGVVERGAPAVEPARSGGAVEIHRGDERQGTVPQSHPHDRQHGLSLYLQLLRRRRRGLPAACI